MKGKNLYLALLSGISLALGFPPLKVGFFAYWGLVPLFFLLGNKGYKGSFKWGYITGLIFNIGTLYWIGWITLPGAVAAILYLPLFFALYALIHCFCNRKLGHNFIFFVPFLWTAVEYIRSLGVLGFPWTSLGYTQTYYLSLIQYASFTSIYGVSFWVATINVLIFLVLTNLNNLKRCVVIIGILVVIFLLPWIYGKTVIPTEDDSQERIRVALVQGNIDPRKKWDEAFLEKNIKIYQRLTDRVAKTHPDLIVWPETATACYLRSPSRRDHLRKIKAQIDSIGVPLLTGSPDYEIVGNGEYLTYNGAFLIRPHDDSMPYYRKIHLVPFGERVPFEDSFPIFNPILERFNMGQGDFSPGTEKTIFTISLGQKNALGSRTETEGAHLNPQTAKNSGETRFALVICYESIFPELVRDFIRKGARFLVIITNDAWFGPTSAPYQHAQIAVFRAIENRISIARCANTGVSMFIDPYGRVLKSSKIFVEETLIGSIPLKQGETFYTRYGNLFTYFTLFVTAVLVAVAIFKNI